jgi:hypothetical protein
LKQTFSEELLQNMTQRRSRKRKLDGEPDGGTEGDNATEIIELDKYSYVKQTLKGNDIMLKKHLKKPTMITPFFLLFTAEVLKVATEKGIPFSWYDFETILPVALTKCRLKKN